MMYRDLWAILYCPSEIYIYVSEIDIFMCCLTMYLLFHIYRVLVWDEILPTSMFADE